MTTQTFQLNRQLWDSTLRNFITEIDVTYDIADPTFLDTFNSIIVECLEKCNGEITFNTFKTIFINEFESHFRTDGEFVIDIIEDMLGIFFKQAIFSNNRTRRFNINDVTSSNRHNQYIPHVDSSSDSESFSSSYYSSDEEDDTLPESYNIQRTHDTHKTISSKHLNSLTKLKIHRIDDNHECTICIAPVKKGSIIRLLSCTHKFHYKCIDEWVDKNTSCPTCRKDILTR